jgi:DNA-binding IclR family transcriptional regulator
VKAKPSPPAQDGTQAIRRAVLMLRLLTRRGPEGWRLSEITRLSGLTYPTARRILGCLADERLVDRDNKTGRYRLGPLNFELGLACEHRLEFRNRLRPALERIAHLSGDTVYLHIRAGVETVCIDRIEGSSPIRAVTLEIGGRRPLGFGSAGLAILALLSDEEVTDILDALQQDFVSNPRMSRAAVLKALVQTRRLGYGIVRDTTVIGVSAIGVALPRRADLPMLGVGLAMVNERLSPQRVKSLYRLLIDELARS